MRYCQTILDSTRVEGRSRREEGTIRPTETSGWGRGKEDMNAWGRLRVDWWSFKRKIEPFLGWQGGSSRQLRQEREALRRCQERQRLRSASGIDDGLCRETHDSPGVGSVLCRGRGGGGWWWTARRMSWVIEGEEDLAGGWLSVVERLELSRRYPMS